MNQGGGIIFLEFMFFVKRALHTAIMENVVDEKEMQRFVRFINKLSLLRPDSKTFDHVEHIINQIFSRREGCL